MAKKTAPVGVGLPLSQATLRIRGRLIIYSHLGQQVAAKWARKRPEPPSPEQLEQRQEFARMARATKDVAPLEQVSARLVAEGSKYTWRDILSLAMTGQLGDFPNYGEIVSQYTLDILGTEPGMIVIRTDQWIALAIGSEAQVLTVESGLPVWKDLPDAVFGLTGDVTAGPGTGTLTATLANTGVTAGSYTAATITVDAKGRLTAASNSGVVSGINQLTGDATAGPGTGSQALTLANSGVTAGTYTAANITVDAKGRLTAASNSGVVSGINQLTGDATAGPGTGSQALTLANSGVSAGSYTLSSITVDAKGRITAASSGSGDTVPATSTTWTPSDVSGASLSISSTDCWYIISGGMVFAWARITFPVTTNTNQVQIGGLPASCKTVTGRLQCGQVNANTTATATFSPGLEDRVKFQQGATFFTNANFSNLTFSIFLVYPQA